MSAPFNSAAQGKYVRANDLDIYYEEYGSGSPLVLLHGGTQDRTVWEEHIPILAQQYRVIAPDSRGHGKTRNPISTLSYRMMADDMAALIQVLGLAQLYVCGFSDGGQICLELGMNYPGLAKGYIAYGATYTFIEDYWQVMNQWGMESPGVVNFEQFEQTNPDWVKYLQQQYDSWQDILTQISHLWLTPLEYTNEELARIAEPTLIITGDRDRFIPVEQSVHLYRTIPQAELAVAPGAGHGINHELVTTFVLDFLQRQSTPSD
jgi:pimeloyl-ACP methyl ester carboxylesterase